MGLRPDRYATLRQIQALDPQQDHQRICHLLAGYEFPWDVTRALEVALLRTFCVPSISQLLDQTGEFQHHAQKRYDDTGLVVSAMLKWGYDSPKGGAFLQRMNAIHSHFPISNEDYLYVLSTFVYEPIRWCDHLAWRPFCDQERLACYFFWRAVGERMGIRSIPPTYEAFEAFNQAFERRHFCYADTNQRVADATRRMLLSWFPGFVQPILKPAIPSLLDPAMLNALGWKPAPTALQRLGVLSLKLRSGWLRQLPPRHQSDFFVDQPIRSYPQGYSLEDIGPQTLRNRLNRSS
jgi:hypothetical protein